LAVASAAPTFPVGKALLVHFGRISGPPSETDDGATIMFEWHGYGRAYPAGRRQIVGAVFHLSDHERYRRLNDVVCVCVGEVRRPANPVQTEPDLVIDVAELLWEPIDE